MVIILIKLLYCSFSMSIVSILFFFLCFYAEINILKMGFF